MITFSGLLNALDGVASAEERIIFLTTNHVENLDAALIRPGRVDLKEFLGNATESQIRGMFSRFYGKDSKELEDAFFDRVKDRQISTASLQVSIKSDLLLFFLKKNLCFSLLNNNVLKNTGSFCLFQG